MQSRKELEEFYGSEDPWGYDDNPHDRLRLNTLLSALPERSYRNVLDIGCGNGFVTVNLPGDRVTGVDISENAIKYARERSRHLSHISYLQASLFDLPFMSFDCRFDLIVITGVLYPQYIGESKLLIYQICDDLLDGDGVLVSCHISEWYSCRFPYITIHREYYPYREYTHLLEVYYKL
ncbi:MAG: class I SAM-dependent methyltransferase [Nitrospirae bacterium]|nr:MAG: class I SAM-dependent methyltransferase [Nitrospirota bacterium]